MSLLSSSLILLWKSLLFFNSLSNVCTKLHWTLNWSYFNKPNHHNLHFMTNTTHESIPQNTQNVLIPKQMKLFVIKLDLRATVFQQGNMVTFFDRHHNQIPKFVSRSRSNNDNPSWIKLGGLLREKNIGGGLGRRDNFLDEDAVEGWNQTLSHWWRFEGLRFFPSFNFFKPSCGISTAAIVQGRNKKKFDECWFSGFFGLYFCCVFSGFFVASSNPLVKFDGCCYLFLFLYFLLIFFGGFCVFGTWWMLIVKRWICWVDDEYDGVCEWITFPFSFLGLTQSKLPKGPLLQRG